MKTILFALGACAVANAGPALDFVLDLAESNPEALSKHIISSPLAAIADFADAANLTDDTVGSEPDADAVPIVFAHGMGDSCTNSGMKSITTESGKHLNTFAVCQGSGDNVITDTIRSFIWNMDQAVDDWAEKIKKNDKLKNGFVCVGFSQGNSLCRGYIQRHNDPPAVAHLSVHGTVSGVAGFPQCNPSGKLLGPICSVVAEALGLAAYNNVVQKHLFQANYLRVPTDVTKESYLKHSQIAAWNNEDPDNQDPSIKTNFLKTGQHILVKAMGDTMVFPNEGEWYGTFADGGFKTVLPMNETSMYKDDSFGLKTADEDGRLSFYSTAGNHLQFTSEELFSWLDVIKVYQK